MSIRAYRLLRNNKEEGPFTAEELVQKNLKPYDLIWVDGRSAAWRYPGELPEFKTYAPLPGDESLSAQNTNVVSASVQAAIAVKNTIVEPQIKQKPRYKVSAAWSKIQTVTAPVLNDTIVAEPKKISASKIVEATTADINPSRSLSWEEAWLDWEKEKTVSQVEQPVKVKPVPVSNTKTINDSFIAPTLETKFTQPLDNLKDKYIENIFQQKQSKKGVLSGKVSQFVIPSLALIIIFSVGYWLLNGPDKTTQILSTAASQKQQPVKTDNTNTIAANTAVNNADKNSTSNNEVDNNQNTQDNSLTKEPVLTDKAEDRKTSYVHAIKLISKQADYLKQQNKFPVTQITLPSSKSTVQKTTNQPTKQFDPSVINNVPEDNAYNDPSPSNTGDLNAANARPVRRRTNGGDIESNASTQKNQTTTARISNVKTSASYVSVPEYVEMTDGSANLKIQNVSDVDLDLVVVDVQYFDASGRFHKGETLYLHNLRAGKNIIVKTPKDINAQHATAKISLVSSDANNVYVVGDN